MTNVENASSDGIMVHALDELSGNEVNLTTGEMRTVSTLDSLATLSGMTLHVDHVHESFANLE